jgi:hypothetical protein
MKKDIVETIREHNIAPIPKWKFRLRNAFLWFWFVLGIGIGAISFSVILLAIQQSDLNLLEHVGHSRVEMILAILPFFWLIALLAFLLLAMLSIRYSWKGYKFSNIQLISLNVVVSIILGTVFFIGGGAQKLEEQFAIRINAYAGIEERKAQVWSNPKEGMLSGNIESIEGEKLVLTDLKGKTWEIEFSGAFIAPSVLLEKGERIKLLGETQNDKSFKALEIRPWGRRNGFMK